MAQENNQKRTEGFMQGEGLAWLNLNNPNGGCCVDVTWTGHKLKLLLEDFYFFFYQLLF